MTEDGSLVAMERARLRALVDGDMERAAMLHADDYQLITPGGAALSKSDYLGGIAAGELRYRRFEPRGEVVVRRSGDTAALRYQVDIEVEAGGTRFRDLCWHTDIYERRDGQWMAVWSQATRISGEREPVDRD